MFKKETIIKRIFKLDMQAFLSWFRYIKEIANIF
jgi:hypothetical protein